MFAPKESRPFARGATASCSRVRTQTVSRLTSHESVCVLMTSVVALRRQKRVDRSFFMSYQQYYTRPQPVQHAPSHLSVRLHHHSALLSPSAEERKQTKRDVSTPHALWSAWTSLHHHSALFSLPAEEGKRTTTARTSSWVVFPTYAARPCDVGMYRRPASGTGSRSH